MASKQSSQGGWRDQSVGKPVMIGIGVLLFLVLGAAGFYAFNGGWKTAGQQDQDYKHNLLPIMAAKHGDDTALQKENDERKAKGQPLLEKKKVLSETIDKSKQSLPELQRQLLEKSGQAAPK